MIDHTFTVGDATVTAVRRVSNGARANYRRIRAILIKNGIDEQSAFEFAYLTAYTKSVDGGEWKPNSADAPESVLLTSFAAWGEFDASLTDEWIAGLFPSTPDPITSPDPLPEDALPNS